MFYPYIYEETDRIQVTVNNGDPVDMKLKTRGLVNVDNWMVEKYGQDKFVTPFETEFEFHSRDFEDPRVPSIFYEYHLVHDEMRMGERLGNRRRLEIADPS